MEIGNSAKQFHINDYYIENKRFALINYKCGDFYFSSNFDSGNLGRVELYKDYSGIELPENAVHAEFNVWTVPDCFGTSNETPNRTWFYFSIQGGGFYQNAKINVKNLNRQAKLFSQGMTPVMKVGQNGHWHRIKDNPTFQNEEENFVISFIHKVQNHPDTEVFYAFTYPFTYRDCLNLLAKYDEKYLKNNEETDILIKQISNTNMPITLLSQDVENIVKKQMANSNLGCPSNANYIKDFENLARKELQNEIYYYRELLIKSLEGRRVDLLTITSFHGIQRGVEKKLDCLFPEPQPRCHIFKNKKTIFLSSRVHPGETPASFVLNGFLNLILDRKNPVSIALRRMYIFKIVPILNPDGVYHGFYRTDTLGQNLNRMYMDTKLEYHPSIYAVKKIIKYYQNGAKTHPDIGEITYGISNSNLETHTDGEKKFDSIEIELNEDHQDNIALSKILSSRSESCSSVEYDNVEINPKTNISRGIIVNEMTLRATENENIAAKKIFSHLYGKKNCETKLNKKVSIRTMVGVSASTSSRNSDSKIRDSLVKTRSLVKNRKSDLKPHSSNSNTNSSTMPIPKLIAISQNKGKAKLHTKTLISSIESGSSNVLDNGNSLFLYIDMHGHASKKGVFMYGNHFTNLGQAVECMLLPKLMTINSQHFHFDACNFSEKNMYRKEKRDGLSKEGSGRVTVYKMTGLVKCYTLECNYNCGKYINVLPSKNNLYSKQVMNAVPPKYTPSIYEEVGRALGPSILDLTNSNTASRLPNSEYRTLQGIRSSLRYEVDRTISSHSKVNTNVTSKISSKRRNLNYSSSSNSTVLSSSKETTKENYREVLNKWNADINATACSSNNNNNASSHLQQPQQTKSSKLSTETPTLTSLITETAVTKVALSNSKLITKTIKKPNSYKIRSTCLYGKKDSPNLITKKKTKILVESSNSVGCGGSATLKKENHHSLQKMSNRYSTNVPTKRVKVTLKTISATTSNCNIKTNSVNTKEKNLKQHQRQAITTQKNQQIQDEKPSTSQISISSTTAFDFSNNHNNSNGRNSPNISKPVENLLETPTTSKPVINLINNVPLSRPSTFLLIGSSISSLTSSTKDIQKNETLKTQILQEDSKQYSLEISEPKIIESEILNSEKMSKSISKNEVEKSFSQDSDLFTVYKNSSYKCNSVKQLKQQINSDDNTDLNEVNTTALIKPENYNINSNISNFIIPSCTTVLSSSTFSNIIDNCPPNGIEDDIDQNNDMGCKNNFNDNCSDNIICIKEKNNINNNNINISKNEKNNYDSSDNKEFKIFYKNNENNNQTDLYDHDTISVESRKFSKKFSLSSSSSSLLPLMRARCKMKPSKTDSLIYKNRKKRRDGANKKIVRNHFYTATENSKIKKKRNRGLDSITIKHKKNKIRNSKF
ncbi:cytosolic carboxypeptidase-like protein 5 [Condylostylus longicornis]|uniref:cytosolic carboxypeptidase-like protein 5 n=1 Tax=Condylostylus longicornis TaxID=2530218 RepID=UPI00244DC585|nr:cytosolic carboxypeptidase-like protein 5 [Condylostylus longicornis]